MHPQTTRLQAFELRRSGASYPEIAASLNVSERSVIRWVAKDDPLTAEQREQITKRAADAKRRAALAHRPDDIPGVIWVKENEQFHRATVDLEDWDRLRNLPFSLAGKGYAGIHLNGQREYLHRMVMGLARGERWPNGELKVVDHLNRDPLDCRKANMKVCTQKVNCANRGGIFEKHDGPSRF